MGCNGSQRYTYSMHDALAPRSTSPAPLDPALGPVLAEFAALKRVPARASAHRSIADEGFRRAWTAILAGEPLEDVARTEVAYAAAQIALVPVDAAQLAHAGVDPDDRRTVYRNAAGRTVGTLSEPVADRLAAVVEGMTPPGTGPQFVDLLASQARAGALREGAARLVMPPEEMQSEHAWSVAVMGGLLQLRRDEPAGPAMLLGLAHHLGDAYAAVPDPEAPSPEDETARRRSVARALEQCPGELAELLAAALDHRNDLRLPAAGAFVAADLIDRVLQQRHYANLAGFSLSDAMDAREFVDPGPLREFQLDVLARFRLTF
ncbi:hypothetical protein [Acuticoccus sediminis]|uniref:hypothetical protein n=1 Tax=Acuticoccus sediminis TaxID=2184697 RepID=UPI001CFE82B1|nr:hypothetical protein [Acuticoccus sediminis]